MSTCHECKGKGLAPDNFKLGAALRKLRESQKASIRDVSAFMGYSAVYICDLELGRRNWTAERVTMYQTALKRLVE